MTDLAIAFRFTGLMMSGSGLALDLPKSFATVTQVACPARVITAQPMNTAKKISNISIICSFAMEAACFASLEGGSYF